MNHKRKLYVLTSDSFQIAEFINNENEVAYREAGMLPILHWPNGDWCLEGNYFMMALFERGLSRREGGTLLVYAAYLSHFIRFCFANKVAFSQLTDNHFSFFIRTIQGEVRERDGQTRVRNARTVNYIGRICLEFLAHVGELHGALNAYGSVGTVKAERREIFINGQKNRSRGFTRQYWHHHAFPMQDPKNRRLPVSSDSIESLSSVIEDISSSNYLKNRRYVMIKLLEITGGRRSEIADLTVQDIYKAARMSKPMLRLLSVKKGGNRVEHRLLPVAQHDLIAVIQFIEKVRRKLIRATCGLENDQGKLLASARTGAGLKPNTITQEISLLVRAAKINQKVCPHMFRHRFITKLFIALIEQHQIETKDEFRRRILDTRFFKEIVRQFTGHSDPSSLDHYIHLAFDEYARFRTTLDNVRAKRAVDTFLSQFRRLKADVTSGNIGGTLALVEALERDLKVSTVRNKNDD